MDLNYCLVLQFATAQSNKEIYHIPKYEYKGVLKNILVPHNQNIELILVLFFLILYVFVFAVNPLYD